ncbi:hypothetical protein JW905_01275 [bacterium]|nr:hypothetical protein [candidate division CSSED10-310 bacterium]
MLEVVRKTILFGIGATVLIGGKGFRVACRLAEEVRNAVAEARDEFDEQSVKRQAEPADIDEAGKSE